MIWLYVKLKQLKSQSAPRVEFVVELRGEILRKMGKSGVYSTTPLIRYALAPLSLALLLGVGTTSYAFASPSVSEGHMLYPLKTGVEQVEGAFYRTPEAKAHYHVKVFQRRVNEAGYVIEHGAPTVIYLQRIPVQFDLTEEQIKAVKAAQKEREAEREALRRQTIEALQMFRLKVERAPMDEHDRLRLLIEIDRRLELLGE